MQRLMFSKTIKQLGIGQQNRSFREEGSPSANIPDSYDAPLERAFGLRGTVSVLVPNIQA